MSPRWRVPLLAAAGAGLLGGLYTALIRLGLAVPDRTADGGAAHGPVMVLGFVGTLVALERAVALGARWALLAPAGSGLGGLVLLAGGPGWAGLLLLSAGGAGLLAVYRALWRRQASVALLAQAAGALCWYAATLLWLGGLPADRVAPWLAGFVVLTIAGERLELARVALGPDHRGAEAWFLAASGAVPVGAAAGLLWPGAGAHLWGLALLGLVGWLAVFDVARHTVRGRGLPRYVAAGLLAGYGWLAVAGLLWAGGGAVADGPRYDAALHAVFLGFTMSMIFAHAPVILPAVLRRPLPYHPVLYAPLALLHLALLVRLGLGDWAALVPIWQWAGVAGEVAIAGFAACAVTLAVRR
ncbi:hypothetical protein [Dactylosporangium sp. CA-092794]|uniref:hypothetical protein n=1 Tax=Dactylosporangium sp. CA-092794 TaxID=3239929 RepID=UPI003D93D372